VAVDALASDLVGVDEPDCAEHVFKVKLISEQDQHLLAADVDLTVQQVVPQLHGRILSEDFPRELDILGLQPRWDGMGGGIQE
jgi:hypothetical protein